MSAPERSVLITEPGGFSPAALALLESGGFKPHLYAGDLGDVGGSLSGREGLIVRFGVHWTAELLRRGDALRFIAVPATGTDHIDTAAARDLGVEVISLAGNRGLERIPSTAEHTFGLLLSLVRRIPAAHRSVVAGGWNRDLFLGRELKGRTLGIVGLGRLGRMVAALADAFGMTVVYFDPFVEDRRRERCRSLDGLAGRSDIVTLHARLDEGTKNLIGSAFFEACRPGTFLVNTARGELIDESELLRALEDGRLAGAALDVLRNEPEQGVPFDSPVIAYARRRENLILTPHVGGATADAMRSTEEMLAGEILRRCGRAGERA